MAFILVLHLALKLVLTFLAVARPPLSFMLFIVQLTGCQIFGFSFQSLTPPYPFYFLSRKAGLYGHYQRNASPLASSGV